MLKLRIKLKNKLELIFNVKAIKKANKQTFSWFSMLKLWRKLKNKP